MIGINNKINNDNTRMNNNKLNDSIISKKSSKSKLSNNVKKYELKNYMNNKIL
jgi:hypothetical protein